MSLDVDQTLNAAYTVGREETARARVTKLAGLLSNDTVVPYVVVVDQVKLNAWYDSVDSDLGLTPHDAYLVINGADVSIEPEVEGTVVNREATTTLVTQGARDLFIANGALPVVATVAEGKSRRPRNRTGSGRGRALQAS